MTTIAVTGHRHLPGQTVQLVDAALRAELKAYGCCTGISCLADGADQLFAQAVLDGGGSLVAVVPARHYRAGLPVSCHDLYDGLLGRATRVVELSFEQPTVEAYVAANAVMLGLADGLMAVWDGLPAQGAGGTAEVVALAKAQGVPVTVVWPEGACRS